jgi:hypothetical protein
MKSRLVVCAAIKNNETGRIICGPRHGHCLNTANGLGLYAKSEDWECGFVDQHNEFMDRYVAWECADMAGQIRCPTGFERDYSDWRKAGVGDKEMLFSENLY